MMMMGIVIQMKQGGDVIDTMPLIPPRFFITPTAGPALITGEITGIIFITQPFQQMDGSFVSVPDIDYYLVPIIPIVIQIPYPPGGQKVFSGEPVLYNPALPYYLFPEDDGLENINILPYREMGYRSTLDQIGG